MLLLFLFLFTSLSAEVTIDLRNPELEEGTLTTSQGGVIQASRFRLQAENISYRKNGNEHTVDASGFVMVDFGDYLFVGDRLYYDFNEETGLIENGVSREAPWIIQGETVILAPNGSFILENATLTTSESGYPDWEIYAKEVVIGKNRNLSVNNLKLKVLSLPVFWAPSFRVNLASLTDAPIRFYTRWGGKQGVRVGARYTLVDLPYFKTFLRFDWRFKRGPGGGIETYWSSEDCRQNLEMINYYANDNSLEDLDERTRYRFQGVYTNRLYNDKVSIFASWDKLSDKDMATDYEDRGLELDTAERTALLIRREDPWMITNFATRIRVNPFQTVKQELPSLLFSQRPYALESSGILFENELEVSYLDFKYSNGLKHVSDYSSPRILHEMRFLRPYHPGYLTITPTAGLTYAFYGNSPAENAKFLLLGYGGLKVHTNFYHTHGNYKHTLSPYFEWEYLSAPTVNPNDHYIFDINDGIWRLNSFRTGVKQDLLSKSDPYEIRRLIETDLYTYLFANSAPISKLYGKVIIRPFPTLQQSVHAGWDFGINELDHINVKNEWTVTSDLAVSTEWRHRNRYSWRKAVKNNYMLDSFRSTESLLNSLVSDRRDTLLCRLFWRIHPQFALEFESRTGWNRRKEPSYNEFEINVLTRLRSQWNVKFAYTRTEADDRVALYFSLDAQNPKDSTCLIRPIEF